MSSEPTGRGFRLLVTTTVVALVLAAAGLTVANVKQGPRLSSAVVNPVAAVERGGQRMVLQIDQAISDVALADITVEPAVPIELSAEPEALIVRFKTALRYGTTYTVTAPVRSTVTGSHSTLRSSFRTPDPDLYVLQRALPADAAGTPDQIVRAGVGPTRELVVRTEPRIQEFAVAVPSIAVVTELPTGLSRLSVGPLGDAGAATTLVDDSLVSQLKSSGPGGLFGFIRTTLGKGTQQNVLRLELYDPVSGGGLTEVHGLKGTSLLVQDWAFVPGTTSVVVQTANDSILYLIDPTTGSIQPLGEHDGMEGFVPGTATLIIQDPGHYTAIDLAAGASSNLAPILVPNDGISRLIPLGGDRGYLGVHATAGGTNLRYSIVAISKSKIRRLYAPLATTTFRRVCLSSNSEYLAVETIPADAIPDGYDIVPSFSDMTTVVLDTGTGAVVSEVPGFGGDWCT
jgi:hypothetical protein